MQNNIAFDRFDELFKMQSFDCVIEIGTSFGGLSIFLNEKSKQYNFNFSTFDIVDRNPNSYELKKIKNRFIKDIFCTESIDYISRELSNDNKCLILCDGGNKIKEFNYFSKMIKKNDFIMAHDYAKDEVYFNNVIKNNFWNWLEIKDSDVIESLHFLNKFNEINFEEAAWLCCYR